MTNRIASRHEFDTRIRIAARRDEGEAAFLGWVRDLSESGIRAFVAQELSVGEKVTILLGLGGTEKELLPAKVARKLGTEYGFQFTALSVEQRLRIRVALQNQSAIPQHQVLKGHDD